MISLSRNLYADCKEVFRQCDVFDSHDGLVSVFLIEDLRNYRDSLPEAHSKLDRVEKTLNFLLEKGMHGEQAVLITFIQVLVDDFIDKEDQLYELMVGLLKKVEKAINPPSAPSRAKEIFAEVSATAPVTDLVPEQVLSNEDMSPEITREHGIPEVITRQHGDILLINKYYADIMAELQKVKDARNLFGDMKKVIYPDKCKRVIKSLNVTATLVQKFSNVVDTTVHLPLVSNPFRVPLAEVLHHLDVLLKKVVFSTRTFCPTSQTSTSRTIAKRQDVYQTLKELVQNLDKMSKLMKSFNKVVVLSERESQLTEVTIHTAQSHSQTSITS